MKTNSRPNLLFAIIALTVFSLLFTSLETLAQKAKRFPIELENSEVSFVGDDSFIIGRYTWEPLPRNHIWKETLTVKGGFMNYWELVPGYQYNDFIDIPTILVDGFNKSSTAQRYGLSAVKGDVRASGNQYGNYQYLIIKGAKGSCANAKQYFGDSTFGFAGSRGDKRVFIGICWSASSAGSRDLESFIEKLMNNVRFDGGAINKIKAATGSISKPAARSSQFRTVTGRGVWEGVVDTLDAKISLGHGQTRGKLVINFAPVNGTCSGFWVISRGSYEAELKPEGTWSVTCSEGVSAGGVFKSSRPGVGEGTGSDNQGRKITFSYSDT